MKKFADILKTQTIKDSFIVFLGTGATAVFGFIFTVIMARALNPADFGVFSALVALVAVIFSLGDLGIGPAIISFLPKHKEVEVKLISTTFWFQYLVGVFAALLMWFLAGFAKVLVPGSVAGHFYLVGSLCFNYIVIAWAQSVLTAKKDFWRISLSQIIDSILKVTIVYYLYKSANLSISLSLLANCISVTVALLLVFWSDLFSIPPTFSKSIFVKLFDYSKWIAASRLFSVFYSKIEILLLNLLATSYQAGIFAAASRITILFAIVVSSLGSVVNPRFASFKKRIELTSYIKKLTLLISGVAIILLVTVVFAKELILLVFGSQFSESIFVFQVLSLSMIPFLYSVIFVGALLYTFKLSSFYALLTALQFAIVLATNLVLIPQMGYMAPVIGTFVSNMALLVLGVRKLKSEIRKMD